MSNNKILGDNPIKSYEQDTFGRTAIAESFAKHVLKLDVSEGSVVGVIGPWGSGKTSFINLACLEFKKSDIPTLDFNPWLFSDAGQLVERFFSELSSVMISEKNLDLKNIGKKFLRYGKAIEGTTSWMSKILGVPTAGEIISSLIDVGKERVSRPISVNDHRDQISKVLSKRKRPIIVVIDDIDRLSLSEIRDVFKLVRLSASFPNLIYILVFDRFRIEQAFSEDKSNGSNLGRDYLEKIVQYTLDLPEIPSHILDEQIRYEIEKVLRLAECVDSLDEDIWDDVYAEIIRPLIHNTRDLRRYIASIYSTIISLENQVEIVDVLGLESIRIFLPDVFKQIPSTVEALTVGSYPEVYERYLETMHLLAKDDNIDVEQKNREKVETMIQAAGTYGRVVKSMIWFLFPSGKEFLYSDSFDNSHESRDENYGSRILDRRVAHREILKLFLERVEGYGLLIHYDAQNALAQMANQGALENFMHELNPERWFGVTRDLASSRGLFQAKHVIPGLIVFLNLLPKMSDWSPASNQEARIVVMGVMRHLFAAWEGPDLETMILNDVLPNIESLYSKRILLHQIVSQKEDIGDERITDMFVTNFKDTLCKEILSASAEDLAEECEPAYLLHFIKNDPGSLAETNLFDALNSPKLTFAILWNHQGLSTSGSLGSRASDISVTINCNALIDLYGGKESLKTKIKHLDTHFEEVTPWIQKRKISREKANHLVKLAHGCLDSEAPHIK